LIYQGFKKTTAPLKKSKRKTQKGKGTKRKKGPSGDGGWMEEEGH